MSRARVVSYAQRLLEAGWLFAAVVAPLYFNIFSNRVFEPDKATLLRVIALGLGLAWLVRQMELNSSKPWREQLRAFWRSNPLTPWVVGLAAVLTLTTLTSVNPLASLWGSYHRLQGLFTYLSYLMVFFIAAYYLRRWAQAQRLVSVILATSGLVALYGIAQHLGYDPIPWGADVTQRVTGSLGNAIFLAAYLIMAVPLTMVRLVSTWLEGPRSKARIDPRWRWLVLYGGLLVVQMAAILFTQSRGPWLGLGAALALGAVLVPWRWGRRRLALGLGSGAAAAALFVILLNIPNSPLSSLRQSSPYLERLGTILDLESGTNKVRMLIWFGDGVGRGTLGLVTDDPVRTVIGHGPESMFVAFNPYYPPTLINYEARGAIPDRSHNDYLDYVVTSGLLGLAAYLAVVVVFFRAAWGYLWQAVERPRQLLLVGLMAGVTAHLVETFFGIAIVATRTHFWLFLGMAVGLMAMPAREPETSRVPTDSQSRGGAARARRQQRRRDSAPERTRSGYPVGRARILPVLFYLALSAALFGLSLQSGVAPMVMNNPPLVPLVTLGWLLLGLFLVTWWLKGDELAGAASPPSLPRPARPPRRWLYLPLGLASAYLVYLLLGMVVADIYFKAGQEYDRQGQYQRAYSLYTGMVRWGIPQDIYFSFLGGYYVQMAQRTGQSSSPGGGPGAVAKIEKVDDLFSPAMSQPWLRNREELLAAARVALEEAQRLSPLNPDNGQNLGKFYTLWGSVAPDPEVKKERFAQANADYEAAASQRPTSSALFTEWGYSLFVGEDDAEAEAKLNRAIELEPDYAPAWALLGEMRLVEQRPKEAAPFFRRTAQAMAARSQDSMAVTWGKTYKVDELLRQADALEANSS